MDYDVLSDLELIKMFLNCSDSFLADSLHVSRSTLNRWVFGESSVSRRNLEAIYSFAYKKGIQINKIKAQFFEEDTTQENRVLLFHGAKAEIVGPLDLSHSKAKNDMGNGFYCGQKLEQSCMYSAGYPDGSVYIFSADLSGLKGVTLSVDEEWMLGIAYYRGRLDRYAKAKKIINIREKIETSDYVIAPIADNKMFSLINNFVDGELTNEQCKHCLSSTDLGNQYVFKTEKALSRLKPLARLYLCEKERDDYLQGREESTRIGNDKVKVARMKYAGKGEYIDAILGD